jgi:hypothetical protein
MKLMGPATGTMLGTYKVSGIGNSENVRKLVVREQADRVSVLMIQDLAGDSIRRHVFFCSLPDGRGLSYELAYALRNIEIAECRLGHVRIVNDGQFGDNGDSTGPAASASLRVT